MNRVMHRLGKWAKVDDVAIELAGRARAVVRQRRDDDRVRRARRPPLGRPRPRRRTAINASVARSTSSWRPVPRRRTPTPRRPPPRSEVPHHDGTETRLGASSECEAGQHDGVMRSTRWTCWPCGCSRRSTPSPDGRASIPSCGRPTGPTPRPTARWRWPRSSDATRARSPRTCSPPPTSTAWRRSRSPDRGSSTSRSTDRLLGELVADVAADERLGVPLAVPGRARRRRLLGAERGQGDAHRAPPHDRHRRRAGPHARRRRPRRRPGEPHRRLGPPVRHAHRAPRRRRRRAGRVARPRRPRRVLQGGDDRSSSRTRRSRQRARARVVLLQQRRPGDAARCGACLVAQSAAHWNDVYVKLGVLLTDDDLAGESRYEALMPEVLDRLGRGRAARGVRRRAGRVPARLHEPRRRAAAADRAQPRRRLHVRHQRPGVRRSIGSSGSRRPACSTSSAPSRPSTWRWCSPSAAMAGWLAPPARAEHVVVRPRARDRPQEAASRSGDRCGSST